MAHDVLWLSIRSDHPDEIAVHMEDGRNPDGSEAGNTGSSPWPCSCRASPSLVSSLGLARLRCPVHHLLPRRLAYGVGSSAEHQIPAVASLLQLSVARPEAPHVGVLFGLSVPLRFGEPRVVILMQPRTYEAAVKDVKVG